MSGESAEKDAIFWGVLRERDDYRVRCAATVDRIERHAMRLTDPSGSHVALMLSVDEWREIRAMLQAEPRVTPDGA